MSTTTRTDTNGVTTAPFRARRTDADVQWQILGSGIQTGGQMTMGHAVLAPRTQGPFLHLHEEFDEAGYVIDGTVTFRVGNDEFEAGPGTLVWMPRGVPHTFANRGDEPARVFALVIPGGLEDMFAEQDAYRASVTGEPDEEELLRIAARHGCHRLGPPLAV